MEIWTCIRVTGGSKYEIKGSKVKVIGNETVKKSLFSCISSRKVDQFTSNQDRNNSRPILHMPSNTLHQRKRVIFAIFSCISSFLAHTTNYYNLKETSLWRCFPTNWLLRQLRAGLSVTTGLCCHCPVTATVRLITCHVFLAHDSLKIKILGSSASSNQCGSDISTLNIETSDVNRNHITVTELTERLPWLIS